MLEQIEFYKYQGTGNDFILIDGYNNNIPHLSEDIIQKMCHRRFGIGADGLIILRKKEDYDFDMDFYNSDGKNGSMCGNGGRCVVAFAHDIGVIDNETTFWAPDGEHFAKFESHDKISLKMQDLSEIEVHDKGLFMDTGSPHLIVFANRIDDMDVYMEGKSIRYNETYKAEGVNVNFVELGNNSISLITYERGVEDVTYSCGTGTVAAAIASSIKTNILSPIEAYTKGGQLKVSFEHIKDNIYKNIWLIGPALKSFQGTYSL